MSGAVALDRLNEFCSPVSNFWVCSGWSIYVQIRQYVQYIDIFPSNMQWRDGTTACQFVTAVNTTTSCHDGVDLSLCFQDTAILYGICAAFMVLAGVFFFCGSDLLHKRNRHPGFWLFYIIKLVGSACAWRERVCEYVSTLCTTGILYVHA